MNEQQEERKMTGQGNCRGMIEHLLQNPTATLVAAIFLISHLAAGTFPSGTRMAAHADPPPLPAIPLQDPSKQTKVHETDSPVAPPRPTPAETEQKKLIEMALRGESVDAPDNMLGDIVEMIQRRGSLLDGSELDHDLQIGDSGSGKHDVAAGPAGSRHNHAGQDDRLGQHGRLGHNDLRGPNDPNRISRNLIAAEQLVRAARLLLETDPHDESTRQLVNQMRVRAVKLIQPQP